MRFAGSAFGGLTDFQGGDHEDEYSPFTPKETEYGEIAMTRGQARKILDDATREALRGNVTPDAFLTGMATLAEHAKSPDATRRLIRNVLASPTGRIMAENPDLAMDALEGLSGTVQRFGVNPGTLDKYQGPARATIRQFARDGLLRPNVTNAEIQDQVQRPLYGAMMDWAKANASNKHVQTLLGKTSLKANLDTWGPKNLPVIAAGFDPNDFGISPTPKTAKRNQQYKQRVAQEKSPAGRRAAQRSSQEAQQFRTSLDHILRRNGLR